MSESEVRQLRANIFGECSDKNWEHCREFTDEKGVHGWMTPENIKWLKDNQPTN